MSKAGRKSTRYGTIRTGRQSPPSKSRVSVSSVSSNGSSRRSSSNAKLFAPRSRSSLKNPFQVSMNLVMKVQEMENQKFSMKPISLSLNDVNYLENVQQRQQQPLKQSSKTKSSRPKLKPSNRFAPKRTAKKRGYEADYEEFSDSVFEHNTPLAKNRQNEPSDEIEASVKSKENIFQKLQKVATESALSKKKNELQVAAASRSPSNSQTSSAGKKKIQAIGNRYKNKRSLLRFRQRARTISFSDRDDSFAPGRKPSDADKTFPLDNVFRNSLGFSALDYGVTKSPKQSLSLSQSEQIFAENRESTTKSSKRPSVTQTVRVIDWKRDSDGTSRPSIVTQSVQTYDGNCTSAPSNQAVTQSVEFYDLNRTSPPKDRTTVAAPIAVDDTVSADAKSDGRSSLKSNTSMSFGSNKPVNVVVANGTITTETAPITSAAAPILINTFSNDKNNRRDSVASETSMCFDHCNGLDVPCEIEVNQSDNASKMYDHLREMRIGFIANGVHMALNVKLNVRSDEEIVYLEPVELLYEGNKMWRRSARQVAKEIEVKRLADKKKMDMLNLSGAQKKQMNEQASPSMKSILKNGNPAAVVDAEKAGPSSPKANGKKI